MPLENINRSKQTCTTHIASKVVIHGAVFA
jgi:hypothetical protein